ncbi:epidermal growth factor-like protein 8 [Nephila pilipes]|uniref:Epidermal growth factor-like protein 8 n=1 Tax=Nephila pilipes TaxID=299642 RepID=A0A8X6NF35_NEPPI|nr:epidermal growth factor-like protein 8 [Nephila pilipes]
MVFAINSEAFGLRQRLLMRKTIIFDGKKSELTPSCVNQRRDVMRYIYFWILLSVCAGSRVQGSGGTVPKRLNDVYYWEQNTAASSNVAKHAERKHANHEEHSSRRLFG